jgi:mRNA interferase RelE/StbE
MNNEEDWDWKLTDRAQDQFDRLDRPIQKHIVSKRDEVVTDEWRTPPEYLEPLTNSPFDKLRVGDYRLGCRAIRKDQQLVVASIRKRSGAYTADD